MHGERLSFDKPNHPWHPARFYQTQQTDLELVYTAAAHDLTFKASIAQYVDFPLFFLSLSLSLSLFLFLSFFSLAFLWTLSGLSLDSLSLSLSLSLWSVRSVKDILFWQNVLIETGSCLGRKTK